MFTIDLLVINPDNGYPYEGICWCEEAVYLDFYNKDVRDYWKKTINTNSFFFDAVNLHIWNDMNEPSVFKTPDSSLPKKVLIKYSNSTYEHRDAHNLYGYLMHRTSWEALKEKYGKRPFVLTRSFWLGSHKFGAVWTGDQRSRFQDLELSIPMIISNSLSGYSFVGADVGGFHGEGDYILYTRWYQLGIFNPFFRGHSHNESYRREPWLYDLNTMNIIRNAIVTRYRLLPYIYFTFFQHFKSGYPIIRPLWLRYNNNKLALDKYVNKQFFFGDALMIRPVLNENEHNSQE